MVQTLQKIIAATLHLVAEQVVLAKPQKEGEDPKDYAERLRGIYRDNVFGAVNKGKSITAPVERGQGA